MAHLRRACCWLVTLLLLGSLVGCAGARAPSGVTVRVAAASDLQYALEELRAVVARTHPEIELAVTYGSSGTFRTQLLHGAPFDLYLSADIAYPQELVDEGLASPDDLFRYAVGRLVLWTPQGSPVDPAPGLSVLADPRIRRVAIANPAHAPYGRAAVAALRSAGQYAAVAPKLVLGESVAQAAEFVRSGNADAGVVARSLVLGGPLRGVGRWAGIPLADHPQLLQGGVVLKESRVPTAARAVRDVLLSTDGRALLQRYGFSLPSGSG